jgi:hypothetical protein
MPPWRVTSTDGVFGTYNLAAHNDNPKPFVWTATAESILEKVRRGRVALQAVSGQ